VQWDGGCWSKVSGEIPYVTWSGVAGTIPIEIQRENEEKLLETRRQGQSPRDTLPKKSRRSGIREVKKACCMCRKKTNRTVHQGPKPR